MSIEKLMELMGSGQPKPETKVTVNVEHYKKIRVLIADYYKAIDEIKDMEENFEKENVHSVRLGKFDIEQHKAKMVWVQEEIDRLVNE